MSAGDRMERGTVVGEKDGMILVEAEPMMFCRECAAAGSCSLTGVSKKRRIWMANSIGARIGDDVAFEVPARTVLAASFILYALPAVLLLGGMFAGGFLGPRLGFAEESFALIGGAAGIAAGVAIIAVYARTRKTARAPVVIRIVGKG